MPPRTRASCWGHASPPTCLGSFLTGCGSCGVCLVAPQAPGHSCRPEPCLGLQPASLSVPCWVLCRSWRPGPNSLDPVCPSGHACCPVLSPRGWELFHPSWGHR